MATVENWTPFGVALDITATNGGVTRTSATQYTVKINVSWESHYNSAETTYAMDATSGGKTVTITPYENSGHTSGKSTLTGTYSISGNGSATKTITVTFKNYDYDGDPSATKNVTFDVTVPAWCTLSYNANGGSGAPTSQSAASGNSVTINSTTKPKRTGYTFKGWSTSSTATSASYTGGESYKLTSNVTLYAVWSENVLTVNYYSNYATYCTYEGEEQTVSSNTNVKVHSQEFKYDDSYSSALSNVQNSSYLYLARMGYTPNGYWGTSKTDSNLVDEDDTYTGQELAVALGKDLSSGNASVDVYPQWKINTYTFSYNANADTATGTMDSVTVEWGDTFVLPDNAFKREGYKFLGWNAYRNTDKTWYVTGQGWITEDKILEGGYKKKLYQSQEEHIFKNSWVKGDEYTISDYTMYAVWEISGVVYIDNGTTFEPYLAYIDNGTDWDLYLMYVDDGTNWNIIS